MRASLTLVLGVSSLHGAFDGGAVHAQRAPRPTAQGPGDALEADRVDPDGLTVDVHAPDLASHVVPRGVPTATVRLPDGGRRPSDVVVLLHGWNCCAPAMVRSGDTTAGLVRCGGRAVLGWGLGDIVASSAPAAALVVPQLALLAPDGRPGRFAEPGFAVHWLDAMLRRAAAAVGTQPPPPDAPLLLAAHSAGYETLLAWLRDPSIARRTRAVVLLDALYAGVHPLLAWVAGSPERRVLSVHTLGGRTARETRRLLDLARRRLGPDAVDTSTGRMTARVIGIATRAPHGAVPGRHLGTLLAALGVGRPADERLTAR
jgi:hypothetical protein